MSRPAFSIFAQQYLSVLLNNFGTVYLNEPIPRNAKLRIFKHPSRFNWGTEYLKEITHGNNQIMISPEVIGEAELVDVLFEPSTENRTSLGLLGKLVSVKCIIETLRWAPNVWELQDCLRHWLTWKAEASSSVIPVNETTVGTSELESDRPEDVDKTLLIIVPSIASQHLQGFAACPSMNIAGIYELAPVFCTTIVVINELPQNISTLWLRLLGRGITQRTAIMELLTLDANHPHCAVVRQQLRQWYQLLSNGQIFQESKRLIQTLAIVDSLD
ncbi:MAG: hypothetical protein VKN72_22500 [Nostocales cyanobacterium 94392]|nr:hypothetical protein [Nostocales cyanobacterium 94392]